MYLDELYVTTTTPNDESLTGESRHRSEFALSEKPSAQVVWVTTEDVGAPRSGGAIRSNRFLRALGREADVSIVVLADQVDAGALLASTGARSVRRFDREASSLKKRWHAVRHGWPLSFGWAWNAEAQRYISSLCASGHFPILDKLHMWAYRPPTGGYLLSLNDVESGLVDSERAGSSPKARIERAWEHITLPRAERRAVLDPRATVVTVSEHDRRELGGQTCVVHNGADVPDEPTPPPSGGLVLFVGSLDYPPNREAVRWWSTEVWPWLAGRLPPLTVVGKAGSEWAPHLAGPGVWLIGEVADVNPYLEAASVVVVPILSGSGSRLKIFEAMAHARPVVSTSKGAQGIDVEDGKDLLLRDGPEQFANAVIRLWANATEASRLGAAGRRIATRHSWEALGDQFVQIVREARGEA